MLVRRAPLSKQRNVDNYGIGVNVAPCRRRRRRRYHNVSGTRKYTNPMTQSHHRGMLPNAFHSHE